MQVADVATSMSRVSAIMDRRDSGDDTHVSFA